jgi:pyruvate kinase
MSRHITRAKNHVFKNSDLNQVLHADADANLLSKTKVVATIGPACQSVEALCDLLEAGMTCARIDLTWAPIEYHRVSLKNLQEAMKKTRRLCAVMLDSLGRELMIRRKYGVDENGWPGIFERLTVSKGDTVTITNDLNAECSDKVFPVTYSKFPAMCQPGDSIFVGRYLVTGSETSSVFLEVEDVTATDVICKVKNDAVLDGLLTIFHQERSQEGLSNIQNDLPCLTDFDKQAIATLCKEFEVDFVSLSFCRSIDDISEARDFLHEIHLDHVKIIAKCETRQSLINFRSLVHASDGVIISRGNLGLDVQAEKMAMVQKAMCSTCAVFGKPAIITRVCDSMVGIPRPTRAEATDIANAVLDGVDGILLGAETYRGKYGLDTIKTTVAICREAEAVYDHENHFDHLAMESEYMLRVVDEYDAHDPEHPSQKGGLMRASSGIMNEANIGIAFSSANLASLSRQPTDKNPSSYHAKLESIAAAAVKTAESVSAALIVCLTHTGRTASLVAKYRPSQPILTVVIPYLKRDGMKWVLEGSSTARQSLLTYGLVPILATPSPSSGEGLLQEAVDMATASGILQADDHVVIVSRSMNEEFLLKVISVDSDGRGIKDIRPKSLMDMIKDTAGTDVTDETVAAGPAMGGRPNLARGSVLIGGKK